MNPRAFLDLAKRLFANEKNPEGLRSTVSRAYYAAFNVAVEFLSGVGCGVPADAAGHEKACHFLNNCGDPSLKSLSGHLFDLRRQRNHADYHLDKPHVETESVVQNWLSVADDVIKKLDDCNGSKERKESVMKTLQAYQSATGT
jgi:uncharacterized protein (UPF0332 family)